MKSRYSTPTYKFLSIKYFHSFLLVSHIKNLSKRHNFNRPLNCGKVGFNSICTFESSLSRVPTVCKHLKPQLDKVQQNVVSSSNQPRIKILQLIVPTGKKNFLTRPRISVIGCVRSFVRYLKEKNLWKQPQVVFMFCYLGRTFSLARAVGACSKVFDNARHPLTGVERGVKKS